VFAKSFRTDDKGAAAVEFGLVAPLFISFLLAIFWAGWVTHETNAVHRALVMGARVVQLQPSTTQSALQTYVRNELYLKGAATSVSVTLTLDPISNGTQLAHLSATFPVSIVVPLVGKYSMTYSTSMVVPVVAS
jgi:Flp pilus assembly protein TadG